MSEGGEGKYCTICGGIPPEEIKIRKILIDGKETGIDKLDFILEEVFRLNCPSDQEIVAEILRRVRVFNYVPTRVTEKYGEALLEEYRRFVRDREIPG
ncbi:MAG: NAC family transcription factor [Methanolinea sp.]|nr:NAC family transcription factor [Methanolinea sp.]